MTRDNILILNPAYLIRQDGNRAILLSEQEEYWGVREWFSFTHPLYCIILSCFNGNLCVSKTIDKAAAILGVERKHIVNFVSQITENPEPVTLRNKTGQIFVFPQRLLVNKTEYTKRRIQNEPTNFSLTNCIDFDTQRLTYPIAVNLELTMSCYVDCTYCYAKRHLRSPKIMHGPQIVDLIRQFKKDGILQIDINGGEVLLHPDIDIILETLSQEGYSPLVSTKIPIDDSTIEIFKRLPSIRLQISLDSLDEDILTNQIKAPADYVRRMVHTLSTLSDYGMTIEINSVITKINGDLNDIEGFLNELSNYSCVSKVKFNPIGFSIYKDNFEKLALDLSQVEKIQSFVQSNKNYPFQVRISGIETCDDFLSPEKNNKFYERAYCTGNTRNVVILPNGDVTVCEELYDHPAFLIGNVTQNSLKDIWTGERAMLLYEKSHFAHPESVCANCNEWDNCRKGRGVCWKSVLIAYGEENWTYPDPRCPNAPAPKRRCFYI